MENSLDKTYLEIKFGTLLADYDHDVLANLYEPLIGFKAFALYLSFWSEGKMEKVTSISTHEDFLLKLKMSTSDFLEARKTLEAIGLLKSYVSKDSNKIYTYVLYAPKCPKSFFDNPLFFGMLNKAVGKSNANKLKSYYSADISIDDKKEISANFQDVFKPHLNDPEFMDAISSSQGDLIGHISNNFSSNFSKEKFIEELCSVSQINKNAITRNDLKQVERIALLNGLDEQTMSILVANIYDPFKGKENHINYEQLAIDAASKLEFKHHETKKEEKIENGKVTSNSILASKINLMESVTPSKYLSYLQNGSKPASSDLKIVNSLSSDFNLPNAVINAIIDVVLERNDNVLSKPYCEKLAASVARKGLTTTLDTMNYLKRNIGRKKNENSTKVPAEVNKPTKTIKKENIEEPDVWDEIINDLEEGGTDGKA